MTPCESNRWRSLHLHTGATQAAARQAGHHGMTSMLALQRARMQIRCRAALGRNTRAKNKPLTGIEGGTALKGTPIPDEQAVTSKCY